MLATPIIFVVVPALPKCCSNQVEPVVLVTLIHHSCGVTERGGVIQQKVPDKEA